MDAWRQQPMGQTPPILIVDGVWVTILYPTGETWMGRSGHQRQQVRGQGRVILAALAVWSDGWYYIPHYEVAEDENADTWTAFFLNLVNRRLDLQAVRIVVSDGSKRLLQALKTFLPQADLQRCTVHKVRGLVRYLSYQDLPDTDLQTGHPLTKEQARQQRRQAMKTEALDIFNAPTKPEAEQRLAHFAAKWQPLEPKAVRNFT